MAERKAAEDEFDPRHRIVGAVVLVALAVIFLPMFLSSQPPENSQLAADRPGAGTRIVTTPVPPFAENAPPVTSPPAMKLAEKDASTKTVTHVVPVLEPVTEGPVGKSPAAAPLPKSSVDSKPPKSAKATTPKSTPPSAKGWTVQVGLFSHAENVSRLQERLKQKGYSVIVDPPTSSPGKLMRVEVGPYKDAAAAKAAQARLRDELSIEGVVRKP